MQAKEKSRENLLKTRKLEKFIRLANGCDAENIQQASLLGFIIPKTTLCTLHSKNEAISRTPSPANAQRLYRTTTFGRPKRHTSTND